MILSDVSLKCHAVLFYFNASICINTWVQYHEIRFCCCLVSLPCVNRFRMCRYFWERLSTFIKKNFWTLCSQYVIYIFVCVDHHLNYSVWHVNVSVNPCFKRSYTVLTQPNQRTKMSETEFLINVVLSPIYFKQEHDEFVWSHVFTL